ncbi:MAG TPA: glycosyltransferase [Candidatus Udaeobacter sp.]|nr:glycosyltransferase [Candidatus Udaeobacter sp.]
MRISIVIACLNASRFLDRCLDGILQRQCLDIEVEVADGGSHDGTVEILQRLAAAMGSALI